MSKQEFFLEDENWAKQLETEYEEYIWDCESSIDGEESEEFTSLSGEPFCGCTTCYTREQLFFLTPRIIKAYKEGKITLNEE
jgi:hypothetical protein